MGTFDRRDLMKGFLAASAGDITPVSAAEAVGHEPATSASSMAPVQTDVLVVGAGASGIPAAIAAARCGARVVLLEDDAVPGGAPVDMFVAMPCGRPIVGIYKEMVDRLKADHNFSVHPQGKATWFLPPSYVRVIMAMIRETGNLELMCGVRVVRALLREGSRNRLEGVTIERGTGQTQNILAKVVVDATGTAVVATLAGCASMFGREAREQFNEPMGPDKPDNKIQECTWMFITYKIRPNAAMDVSKLRWMPNESGYGWVKRKDSDDVKAFLKRDAGIYLHWGGHIVCEDTLDPVCIAKAHLDAMGSVIERDAPWLTKFGYGITLAPKLGVRETRRVVGDYVLTVNDLLNPKWPDDVVAVGQYGLDSWGDQYARPIKIPANGYGIPYRALLAKDMTNLLVVGKTVSSTHLAQSAVRVQPIVSQMGQAAGTAAALSVAKKTDLRSIPITELQQELKDGGLPTPPASA